MTRLNYVQSRESAADFIQPKPRHTAKRLGYVGFVPLAALFVLTALLWFLGGGPSLVMAAPAAATYYAWPSGTNANACSSADPCSLTRAIELAIDGDEIRVASGSYSSAPGIPVMLVTESITITGGYLYNSGPGTWSSTPDPLNTTILDGGGNGRVVEISANINPIIENFHIQNGQAINGAGIYIADGVGRAIIRHNFIHNNIASGGLGGGGIYDGGAATIAYNEISDNQANPSGAGIYIHNNGAAITSTIRFNDIYNNTAASSAAAFGGGVFLFSNAKAEMAANNIYQNTADIGGGFGAFGTARYTMHSNMIYDNTAVGQAAGTAIGGGIWAAANGVIWNNTIVGNTANDNGAGIHLESGVTQIHNTIVAFNSGGGVDGVNNDNNAPATVSGSYNNLFDDTLDATITFANPVSGNPSFVNLGAFNLHLSGNSPLLNVGSPATPAWVYVDIDGQVRPNPNHGAPPGHEVGADEYYPDFRQVSLNPPSTVEFVDRGTTAVYTHTVRNDGTLADTYDFTCSNDLWSVVCPSSVGLAPGQAASVATSVVIPADALAYAVGLTQITATSQISTAVFDRATVQSTVRPRPGISFTPNYSRTELPGDVITLTHFITNTGDAIEDFIITEISDTFGWGELLPADPYTITINAGAVRSVQLQITVPAFAPQGLENVIRLRASSQFDPAISDTVVNTITAKATTGTRYVRFGGIDTNNNCTQPDNACGSIKHAVGQAASGDEVRIGAGTFPENNINVNDSIVISGGWNGFNDDGQGEKPDPALTKIDAGNTGPVFVIGAGSPVISTLTLQNGRSLNGGAVFVNAGTQPEFVNAIFAYNTATNSGGAIYVSGGLVSIQQSRFLTNTASSSGGALTLNSGLVTAQNNLFHNNNTGGSGGAVRLNSGTATFNFNTWAANGAVVNGGGVYNNGATAAIQNSIFADNTAVSGSAVFQNAGSTTMDYLNLWNNTANTPVGSHSFTADPLFADELFRLGDGSPAIDAADPNATLPVDFENDFRPSDEGHDIGYDERAGCRAQRADVIYGSIQDAVDVSNPDILVKVSGICRGVHTIDVGGVPISQTVHLTKSVIIQGGWDGEFSERYVDPTLVDPEGRGRAFYVTNGVSVTIEGLTVTHGSAVGLGGGPADEDAGGGFYNVDGRVTLMGVRILTGTAELGGGFYNDSGAPRLTWAMREQSGEEIYTLSEIAGNSADAGGGVYNHSGGMVLDGAWLRHNQAAGNGGGLFNLTGPMTVANTILDSNAATLGGGLYNAASDSAYLHMTVYSNTAVSNGGGVYNASGQPTLANNIFESNQAASGSAIYDAADALVDYNYYYLNGGTAVFGTVTGTHSIESSTVAPGLVDPAAGDFHLFDEAPAADVGDPESPVKRDFEDDLRPSNQGVDMGADEILGCLVQLNDELYGSLQAAIDAAQPGDEIKVSGICSGVHPYDSGEENACGGEMQTAVHVNKDLLITGGWDEEFREQEPFGYSVLDAKNLGRVLYIGQGISTTVAGFDMINGAADNGAGVCSDNARPTLYNNRIYSNTAVSGGGGMYLLGSGGMTATVKNNFIYFNEAANGAGVYNGSGDHAFWHNTVYGNIATGSGGAYHVAAGAPDIRGSILMANEAGAAGAIYAVSSPTVGYNDYYQNTPGDFGGGGIANGGPGSISADPVFYNVISGVFTITIDSPVVDFDIPNMPVLDDFEGDLRPSHQGYDLGADEVGGCYATVQGATDVVYGSVQLAVDMAPSGGTVLVDGICQNVNSRLVAGNQVSQTLVLTKSLVVDGSWDHPDDTSGVTTTLQALGNGRVVYVANGVSVTLTNFIMRQGDANGAGDGNNGGGVYNEGILNVVDAWVQESTAVSGGGLYNEGTLTLDNTDVMTNTASADGGGLYNDTPDGVLTTIQGSNFRNNLMGSSGDGGGIYHEGGALMLDGNRIHVNGYTGSPGGNGGGIYLNSGAISSVDVRNNFIYGNWANEGGGLYNANTNGRLWHNTFFANTAIDNNGGGLASLNGSPDIRNNIVDNNDGYGIYTRNGLPTINYNNAVRNSLDNISSDVVVGGNNISARPTYVSVFEEDFHLLQGSRGEDEGDPAVTDDANTHYVADDIDGHVRPTNSGPDMGADEIDSCRVRVEDEIFGVLQDAIDYAESSGFNTLEIARGECRGTFERNGTRQVAYVSEDLTFIGSLRRLDFVDPGDFYNEVGRNSTLINANFEGRTLYIANGAVVSFTHVAFINGNAFAADATTNDNGGAIYNDGGTFGAMQVYLCNSVAENGAGYYGPAGSITDMTGSTIGACTPAQVTEDPNTGAVVSVDYVRYLEGNLAGTHGGGAYIAGDFDMRNMGFIENGAGLSETAGNGGGLYNSGGNNRLVNGYFYSNTTPFDGGALYNAGSGLRILHNTVRNNWAGDEGGGIYNSGGSFELNSSILYTNTAVSAGGGLYSTQAANLTTNNFYDNAPNDSNIGLGANAYTWDPKLRGFGRWSYHLSVTSPNIDRANPALLPEVDYDIQMLPRPDGDPQMDPDEGYQPPHGLYADIGADEYHKDFGCEIDPDSVTRQAAPGEVVTYTLKIINVGNPPYTNLDDFLAPNGFTDTITITLLSQVQGWSAFEGGEVQTVELGWQDTYPNGGYITRALTVTVPLDAQVGRGETTIIQCESTSLPERKDTATINTDIGLAGEVLVVPDYVQTAVPGQVITYEQTVINQQNQAATYRLTPSSGPRHANAVLLDSLTMSPTAAITVSLAPSGTVGYTTTAWLQVTILDTAMAGDIANPGLVAQDITAPDDRQGASIHRITILPTSGTRYVADIGANTTNCTDPLQPCATIQHAIDQAQTGDEIRVAGGIYTDYVTRTVGIDLFQQNVFIDKSLAIRGGYSAVGDDPFTVQEPITNSVVLNGQGERRVIYVADGISVTLSGLRVINGRSNADLSMNGSTLDFGGGIYNAGADLTIYSSWLQGNVSVYGGGLYHHQGRLTFYSNVVADNQSPSGVDGEGGGIYAAAGENTIENNTFSGNDVDPSSSLALNAPAAAQTGSGGAIFLDAAEASVFNNIFIYNNAIQGRAIYVSATADITNDYNLYFDDDNQEANFISGGNWGANHLVAEPQFDPLNPFHILATSPAKDTGTPTVTISQSVDIDLEPRIMGPGIDIGADERVQRPGMLFEPEVLSATINAGESFTYEHILTNTGDFIDSYSLSLANQIVPPGDASWTYGLSPQSITDLQPMDSVTVTLVVTGGQPGYVSISTITADSASGLSRAVTDTTRILQDADVDIEQSSAQTGLPGELVTYTHTLTNTGNGIDQFELTATAVPTDWLVSLIPAQTPFLAPLATMPFTVTVLIPADALSSTQHVVTVTAVAADPFASDTLTDTTTVGLVSGLTLVPDYTRAVPDGTSTIYTHTLTSGSNIIDSITLDVTGSLPGWGVAVEPTLVTLNPFESRVVSVTVTVPPNTGGLTHVANVTATSSLPGITASATDTTTVPVETGLLFTPDYSRVVNAGTTEEYTHTLTNLGNITDTFALSNSTTQGWLDSITTGPLAVAPGASVPVTAVVSIPLGTSPATEDILVITATSQADTAVSGAVTDTTRVIQRHELDFYPDRTGTADAGTTVVYTHTLENLGDGVDTFNLTYSGAPNWPLALPPTPITLDPLESTTVVVTLTIPSGASGLTNVTHITATSTISPAFSAVVTDTTTVSGVVADLGVDIEPDNFAVGALNETLTYTHTVTNTGSGPDDIGLSVISAWVATIEPAQVTLASGDSAPVTVTVTIPGTALAGEEDNALVTAVSLSDDTVFDTVTDTSRVVQNHGLLFFPDRAQTVNAGTTAVYSHTLRNTGDAPDTFAITPNSASGWTAVADSPLTLDAGEQTTVFVTLTAPAGSEGQVDVMQVTASSVISPAFSAMVTDTTTVSGVAPTAEVQIEPDYTGYGVGGDTIQYVHTVTNTGSAAATFTVDAVSSQRWTPDLNPLSLALGAGETGLVTVTVTIPAGVNVGTTDVTTVTVTSQADPTVTDFAVDTTIVPGVFLPVILKAPPVVVPPTPTPGPTPTNTPTATPPSCTTPTGKDLIVTQIRVEPAVPTAGVPATVYVTIRNQGTVSVAPPNNFYADFYVDRVPARYLIGDIEWPVQGEWMGAGQSYTLSRSFIFSGGSHQLWAQVDTDNSVDECPFENNNVLGPIALTVSGAANGADAGAQQTQPNEGPRATPTPESSAVVPDENVELRGTERPLAPATPSATPTLTVTPPPPGEG